MKSEQIVQAVAAKKSGFNGHKNWSYWNVSLWINNDESLYRMARDYCRNTPPGAAAVCMFRELSDLGVTKTPDGAPYSVSSIRAAMVGM